MTNYKELTEDEHYNIIRSDKDYIVARKNLEEAMKCENLYDVQGMFVNLYTLAMKLMCEKHFNYYESLKYIPDGAVLSANDMMEVKARNMSERMFKELMIELKIPGFENMQGV